MGTAGGGEQDPLAELGKTYCPEKRWRTGVGYKDLHTFNLAMLAKQGWRLLTCPESLCARVLKAKYFPHSDVLGAQAKDGISYVWRSILKGG